MSVPVRPTTGALRPLGLADVRLTGGYWAARRRLGTDAIVPHCLEWIERSGWVDNLRGGRPRRGPHFADSEVYKLVEAMVWTGAFEAPVAELADVFAAAQEPDGYLHSGFGRAGQPPRYHDPQWGHELYCTGHLIQAAVARLRVAGEDTLVRVARRAADHACVAGVDVCGHPEIETALVELFRATGEDRYLERARSFVDQRGRGRGLLGGRPYFCDDVPVRAGKVFGGHAVRALYLACGAVDVAVETGDDELLGAIVAQWERTVVARTYLTGGMGARTADESFGEDFELPPDTAYAETCAGVASVMLCWRLLLATGEARYADLAERTLYNVVAGSTGQDGRSYFYANPLGHGVPTTVPDPDVPSRRAVTGARAPWFEVSCCPTNVARLFASLPGYVATVDRLGVQLHQLAPAAIRARLGDGRPVGLDVATAYPWRGEVRVRVTQAPGGPWRISVRVPVWADGATLRHGGGVEPAAPGGYATVDREWRPGDELVLDLPLSPRWTVPDPRIDAVVGTVAVERGPLVYCTESEAAPVSTVVAPAERDAPGIEPGAVALTVPGLDLIPYYSRARRGPSAMRVFLPLDRASGQRGQGVPPT